MSAAWGRLLGLVLLTSMSVPSYAGVENRGTADPQPDSVVWGKPLVPTPTPTTPPTSSGSDVRGKIAADLNDHVGQNGMVTVIVQYRTMPKTSTLSNLKKRGAEIRSKLHVINAVTMHIPATMAEELAQDPNVVYITPDRPVQLTSNPVTEEFATAVEADVAASNYGFDGTGIGVAVIDSGISDHGDLHKTSASGATRVVYKQSFVSGDSSTSDKFGHGTHVAGLIGGTGAGSGSANNYPATYAGMAPNVNLINLRVLDQNGLGTDSQVIAAIQEAISLKSTYNIGVINMSLGRPVFESYTQDPVDQAVESAWKAGIVVVCAAGNNGRFAPTNGFGTIGVPANDPAVITVGATLTELTATRADDVIASYSSKGPTVIDHIVKPDLVAPGNRLVSLRVAGSTLDTAYPQFEIVPSSGTSKYFMLSGTSMATPVVSGAVALMLQQNSSMTPDQVKVSLMMAAWQGFGQYSSSYDQYDNCYNNEYDIFTYGAGYLDINAALGNPVFPSGVALSPTAVVKSNGTVVVTNTALDSNFSGSSVVWGSKSIFADSVVWGANTISSTSVVWGATSVVWGATSVSGYSVVWGATTNVLSSTAALASGDPGDNN